MITTGQLSDLDRTWSPAPEALSALRRALWPEAVFGTIRQRPTDDHRRARERRERVVLDGEQLAIAASFGGETVEVRVPARSGKTLILLARARLLLKAHPDWTVQFLCFNRPLVTYVKTLVADLDGVRVETIYEFARRHGRMFDAADDEAVRAMRTPSTEGWSRARHARRA